MNGIKLGEGSYLVGESFDYVWCSSEVKEVRAAWNDGATIEQISKEFKRSKQDVLMLLIDQDFFKRLNRKLIIA